MQRQKLFISLLVLLLGFSAQAQDPIYSQYYSAPLQLNPAFAGNTYAPHISINYRNQWPSLSQAYVSYSVAYSQFFKEYNSGFGLMLLADDAGNGLYKTTKASGVYSYRVAVNDDLILKLGLEGSLVRLKVDWLQLTFPDQLNADGGNSGGGIPFPTAEVQPENTSINYFDASAGLLMYGTNFYAGITAKHLNTPNESFHAGYEYKFRSGNKKRPDSFISPNVMFVKQGDFGQINAGAYGNLGRIFAIVLFGVQAGGYKIGYSYDITVSKLTLGQSGGSHEISLIMNFEKPEQVDYNDCFGLFR